MRIQAKLLLGLLPFTLTACFHARKKPLPAPPPPIVVPQPQPEPQPEPRPQPEPPKPAPSVVVPAPKPAPAKPAVKSKPSAAHYPPPNRQMASSGVPSVSAIGQLSSGDSSTLYQQTTDSLALTERRLNNLTRALSLAEQQTAAQVRAFLKQAHRALDTGDLDGASTLAAKAKTLLGELLK